MAPVPPSAGGAGIPHASVQTSPSMFVENSSLPSSHTQTLVDRSKKFIEEHKLLVLGAAVLAASGVGYYLYSTRPKGPGGRPGAGSADGQETGASASTGSAKKKKKSKSKSSKKSSTSTSGPILEERDPEEVKKLLEKREKDRKDALLAKQQQEATGIDEDASAANTSSILNSESGLQGGFLNSGNSKKAEDQEDSAAKEAVPTYLEGIPSGEELKTLSANDRKTFATTLKNRGNKLYSAKKYSDAIACYTKALEVAEKPEAVFYSNRAACYQNMSPPDYEQVVRDCDAALNLDQSYVKALNRRATAYEALGREEESLRDFTATTIMERFQNDAAASSVERVLRKLATKKAEEILKTREPKLPSNSFVAAYIGAFRTRPKPEFPTLPAESNNTGNETLSKAMDAHLAGDFIHAFTLVNEALEQGLSPDWKEGQAEALNLRGTYKFLIGDTPGAKEDFEKSLDLKPDFVQSLVKVASVHMEMGDAAGAFGDFEAAIRHNADDPDIYYHRGQLYFVSQDFTRAAQDYEKSTSLDPTFVFSHIQHAVAKYKLGETREAMAEFRRCLKQFQGRSEPLNYYGEILLDQQRFDDAIEKFDAAIEIEKTKTPSNVLPIVNKALAVFQAKQDMLQADKLCREALEIDPECDVAVATLAQLSLQQGKIEEAIGWFERSAKMARTEMELTSALQYEHASRAQLAFLRNYPQMAERLGQLAQQV